MENRRSRCPGCRRISCDGCGMYEKKPTPGDGGKQLKKLNTNKQIREEFPKGFEVKPGEGTGISFDVGTTTLAGMLWDLKKGILLDAETDSNPQAVFGADIISRIQAARKDDDLKRMQAVLAGKLDEMAQIMAGGRNICKAVFVGNTAMCEILLGIKPSGLFKAPFTPDYNKTVRMKGRKLGFCFLKDADILVLPPVGGYVGSDALAVYSCVNMEAPEKNILAVDIGTNGEILLRCGKGSYACSAAAGPALEGGAVSFGMRAARGAIDMVSLNGSFPMEDVVCRVIGGGVPSGICGSGLVDALAALLKAGVLDDTGYIRSASEARLAGVSGKICRRIRTGDKGQKFLLTEESHPVYITSEDVRHLQLAISALRSGMEVLLQKAGLGVEELDGIYLAGAFGCYIGIDSALAAGLCPAKAKIVQAGNLAGVGSAMALLSETALEKMEAESREIVHVELAEEEDFKEKFLTYMNFKI